MISIQDFCDQHRACKSGREWAIANCTDMADVWHKLKPRWLIWVATRPGVLGDCELRSYIVFCVQQVEHLAIDRCNVRAIETAEKFAEGELASGGSAAAYAADAAGAAAYIAFFTGKNANSEADGVAAERAIVAAQAEWLRANTQPNFGVEVAE